MAEADDIVVRVVLTGNEEVSAAFGSMREAGEKAFLAIDQAAARSLNTFGGMATVLGGLTAAVATVGGVDGVEVGACEG